MRCFVLDPVCAFGYGHSVNALRYFSNIASTYWEDVIAVPSIHLPEGAVPKSINVSPFFEFYYDSELPITKVHRDFDRSCLGGLSPKALANFDVANFHFYYSISPNDSLIVPSVDYEFLRALLSFYSDSVRMPRAPRLYIRFIGVLENARGIEAGDRLLQELGRYMVAGGRIHVAAETPKLAKHISGLIGGDVCCAPYPCLEETLPPMPVDGPFTIMCGGSARPDKGFSRLEYIISDLNRRIGYNDIQYLVQGFPPTTSAVNSESIKRVYTKPNVTLFDGILDENQIVQMYERSHLSLMPYDKNIYSLRGSAILMESINYRRLVAGQSGTGFADQIRQYDCGVVCTSNDDFAQAIEIMYATEREELAARADRARAYYSQHVGKAYKRWFGDTK